MDMAQIEFFGQLLLLAMLLFHAWPGENED